VQRLNELHRQELEAQKVVSNGGPMGSMSPKQPGACINGMYKFL